MGILRRSGYEDRIRVIIPEKLMDERMPQPDELMELCGQVRTYNRESEGKNRLEVTVFARQVRYEDECSRAYENRVMLEGYICKPPVRRTSPLGREICDLMIAVNRMYNKSDYIPTIAWGRNAVYGGSLEVGDKVALEGRIQSREYRKFTDERVITRASMCAMCVKKCKALILCCYGDIIKSIYINMEGVSSLMV